MSQLPKREFLVQLRNLIHKHFNFEEFRTLCFDLGIQYDDLLGEGLQSKIRELISRMDREQRLEDILKFCTYQRPKVVWPTLDEMASLDSNFSSSISPIRNPRLIFISHASQDADFARRLANDLSHHDWDIWIAPDSIRPGERWVDAINRGLAQSSIFLLILTPEAVDSKWVQSEANVAISQQHHGEIRFMPLELKQTKTPPLWQNYQWIPFQKDYKNGLGQLLQVLLLSNQVVQHQKNKRVINLESREAPKEQRNTLTPNYPEFVSPTSSIKHEDSYSSAQLTESIQPHLQRTLFYPWRGISVGMGRISFSDIDGRSIMRAGVFGIVLNGALAVLGNGIGYVVPSMGGSISFVALCCGTFGVPIAAGILSSYFTPGKTWIMQSAYSGGLSGIVAGIAYGILNVIMILIISLVNGFDMTDALASSTVPLTSGCCGAVIFGLILGAIGGAVWTAMQKEL